MNANPRLIRVTGAVFAVVFSLAAMAVLSACPSGKGGGEVMAKVNGSKIMKADVDRYYNAQREGAPAQPSAEEASAFRLNILGTLIEDEIIRQRAEKLGLIATDDEVDRKLNEAKAPYTQEEFDARLKEQGRTVDQFKDDLRRAITAEKVINKEVTSKINISDGDIKEYYEQHKAEFNFIEPQYRVAHIIVTPMPGPVRNRKNSDAKNDAEAKRKVQEIVNRLDSGEEFGAVAADWSEDPDSAATGGELGLLAESSLNATDTATRDAVLRLKPGQYSQPVPAINPQTRQMVGYRIVRLISKEPAGQRDLSNPRVQQAIRNLLRDRREQLLRAAYFQTLRNDAKIENYYAQDILKNSAQKS